MALWIDLSSYGIELKRVELSNGKKFPVALITNIDMYNSSGAKSLSDINGTGFQKLPGDKKGRAFNTPMLYLTNSFAENGESEYKLMPALIKLLNTSKEHLDTLKGEFNIDDITLKDAFADFDKFNSVINEVSQTYAGNTIYMVRESLKAESLNDYAAKIYDTQHRFFPKASPYNLPLEVLDNFNYNSGIFRRAFLNPQDAFKQNYKLSDLEVFRLNGENTFLPVSINGDLSLNIIPNAISIQPLAYSNYNWKKGADLINDYNALVSLREMGREVLNASLSNVHDVSYMSNHLEKMSSVLRNYHEVNNYGRSNMALKGASLDQVTLISQNEQGDWRFYEKSKEKIDEPLSWSNYVRALNTIANQVMVVTSALNEQVKTQVEFDRSMDRVLMSHNQLYRKFTNASELGPIPNDNRIYINLNGAKLNPRAVNLLDGSFERDVGENLYTEAFKRAIGDMANATDSSRITSQINLPKQDVDIESPNVYEDYTVDATGVDIGLDILDTIDINSAPQRTPLKASSLEKYFNLPKGISQNIDNNYEAANEVYTSLQYINLATIPYLKSLHDRALTAEQNELGVALSELSDANERFITNGELIQTSTFDVADLESDKLEQQISRELLKSEILRYQLSRLAGSTVSDLDVINSVGGEFKAFESGNDYDVVKSRLLDHYAKTIENGDTQPLLSNAVNDRLESFIDSHYKQKGVPGEEFQLSSLAIPFAHAEDIKYEGSKSILPITLEYLRDEIHSKVESAVTSYSIKGSTEDGVFALNSSLNEIAVWVKEIEHQIGAKNVLSLDQDTYRNLMVFEDTLRLNSHTNPQPYDQSLNVPMGDLAKLSILSKLALDYNSNEKLFKNAFKIALDSVGKENPLDIAGRFLTTTQTLTDQDLSQGQVYAYSLTGREAYRVKAVDQNAIDNRVIPFQVLKSTTYEGALRETYQNYLTAYYASQFGLSAKGYNNILEMADSFRGGDLDRANSLLNELSVEDSTGFNSITRDSVVMLATTLSGKLNGEYEHEFKNLIDLKPFDKALSYLVVQPDELAVLKSLNHYDSSNPSSTDHLNEVIATKAISNLSNAPFAVNETQSFYLSLSVPESSKDVIYARVVPESWMEGRPHNYVYTSAHHYNMESISTDKLDKHSLIRVVEDSLSQPFSTASGKTPSIITSLTNNDLMVRDDLKLLTKEGLGVIHQDTKFDVHRPFETMVYGAMINTALANASDQVRNEIINSVANTELSDRNLSIFVEYANKGEIPLLHIKAANEPAPPNALYGSSLNAGFLGRTFLGLTPENAKDVDLRNFVPDEGVDIATSLSAVDRWLKVSGFDLAQYKDRLSEHDLNDTMHKEFKAKFTPNDLVSVESISKVYAREIYDQVQNSGVSELSFELSSTPFLPYPSVAPESFESLTFNKDDNLDSIEIKMGLHFNKFHAVPRSFMIDTLPSIALPTGIIESSDLMTARIAAINSLMDGKLPAYNKNEITSLVDNSSVFIKNVGGVPHLSLAATAQQGEYLTANGFNAISIPMIGNNQKPFEILVEANITNHQSRIDHVTRLVNLAVSHNKGSDKLFEKPNPYHTDLSKADEHVVTPTDANLMAFVSIEKAEDYIIEQINADKEVYVNDKKLEYAEKFNYISHQEMSSMSSSQLMDNLSLEKLWPDADVKSHILSGAQELDALVFTKAIKNSLPPQPIMLEETSFENSASTYHYALSEIHGAISISGNLSELVDNYRQAQLKIMHYHPEFISSCPKAFKEVHGALINTSKQLESNPKLNVVDVLNESLSKNINSNLNSNYSFGYVYSKAALEVAKEEKLFSGERSFVNYMDGVAIQTNTLNLSTRMLSRFDESRLGNDHVIDGLKKGKPLLSSEALSIINSISSMDFNSTKQIADIGGKWGVTLDIDEKHKHLAEGYVRAVDQFFTQLSDKLGIDSNNQDQLGRGITIESNKHLGLDDGRIGLKPNLLASDDYMRVLAGAWISSRLNDLTKAELSLMGEDSKTKLLADIGNGKGFVDFALNEKYSPKTKSGEQLIKLANDLINGKSVGSVSPVDQLLTQSAKALDNLKSEAKPNEEMYGEVTARYYAYMHDNFIKKQDVVIKQLTDKFDKIAKSNPTPSDLYHYRLHEDLIRKSYATKVNPSSVTVAKFISDVYPGSSKSAAEQLAAQIETVESFSNNIQAHLHARVSDKVLNSLSNALIDISKLEPEKFVVMINKDLGDILHPDTVNVSTKNESQFVFNYKKIDELSRHPGDEHFSINSMMDELIRSSIIKDEFSNGALKPSEQESMITKAFVSVMATDKSIAHHQDESSPKVDIKSEKSVNLEM